MAEKLSNPAIQEAIDNPRTSSLEAKKQASK
jgi:hypothetical protein